MLEVAVPGCGTFRILHCVSDFSGTLSVDGRLHPGVRARVALLAERVRVHVLTADTHGLAAGELAQLPCVMRLLSSGDHTLEKRRYVQELGAEGVFAIGNGNNDVGMLRAASVGVAVCLAEGCSREAAAAADILVTSPEDALDLLLHPMRLTATLRR